jgi:undecaprenyl-diphosphatase
VEAGDAFVIAVHHDGPIGRTVDAIVSPPGPPRPPPITLAEIRARSPVLVTTAVIVAIALGVLASIDRGRLLVWDRPITDAVVDLRSPSVDRFARWVSRLGSTPVVLTAGVAGIALAARRSRPVAIVMFVVVAARPPFEWLLKEIVARPRPSGARLVPGTGFAYPSGDVLAAAATWGFVPAIAALYLKRRWLWWTLTAAAWTVIGLIAWCRVWLGVHWTCDVVGGLAIAVVALSTARTAIDRRHHPPPICLATATLAHLPGWELLADQSEPARVRPGGPDPPTSLQSTAPRAPHTPKRPEVASPACSAVELGRLNEEIPNATTE